MFIKYIFFHKVIWWLGCFLNANPSHSFNKPRTFLVWLMIFLVKIIWIIRTNILLISFERQNTIFSSVFFTNTALCKYLFSNCCDPSSIPRNLSPATFFRYSSSLFRPGFIIAQRMDGGLWKVQIRLRNQQMHLQSLDQWGSHYDAMEAC